MKSILAYLLLTITLCTTATANEAFSQDPADLQKRVVTALAANDPASAQLWLAQWRQIDPRDLTYLQLQAHVYNVLGAPAAAVEVSTAALTQSALSGGARRNLELIRSQSLISTGELLAAHRQLTRLLTAPDATWSPELRRKLEQQQQDVIRDYMLHIVGPSEPPDLDVTADPANVPPDLANLMIARRFAQNRKLPPWDLIEWSVNAAKAHPESPELVEQALLITLVRPVSGMLELAKLPGFAKLPKVIQDELNRRLEEAGTYYGSYDPPPEEGLDFGLSEAEEKAYLAKMEKAFQDTKPTYAKLMAEKATFTNSYTAVSTRLRELQPSSEVSTVFADLQTEMEALEQQKDPWYKAVAELRTAVRKHSLTDEIGDGNDPAQPILDKVEDRDVALLSDHPTVNGAERAAKDDWIHAYRRLRPIVQMNDAMAKEEWQDALNASQRYLVNYPEPDLYLYSSRFSIGAELGDLQTAYHAALQSLVLDPDQPSLQAWINNRLTAAHADIASAKTDLEAGNLAAAATKLDSAQLFLPSDGTLWNLRFQLGVQATNNPVIKAEALRQLYALYEPLPVSTAEACDIALQAADWQLLLSLSRDPFTSDPQLAFYHYIAATALALDSVAKGVKPLTDSTNYRELVRDIELNVYVNKAYLPKDLNDDHRSAWTRTMLDGEQSLEERVKAAKLLALSTPDTVLEPIRSSYPIYLRDGSHLTSQSFRSIAPGQQLIVLENARIASVPDTLSVLRLAGGTDDKLAKVKVDNSPLKAMRNSKLRLLEVDSAIMQCNEDEKLLLDGDSVLVVNRGTVSGADVFHGNAHLTSAQFWMKGTSPSSRIHANHSSLKTTGDSLDGIVVVQSGSLFMPLGETSVSIGADAEVDLDGTMVYWPRSKQAGTVLLNAADGARVRLVASTLVGLPVGAVTVPADAVVQSIHLYGEPGAIVRRGSPIPATAITTTPLRVQDSGQTYPVTTVGELRAAAAKAKAGDTIELAGGQYELDSVVELSGGVRVVGQKGYIRPTVTMRIGERSNLMFAPRHKERAGGLYFRGITFRVDLKRKGKNLVTSASDPITTCLASGGAPLIVDACSFYYMKAMRLQPAIASYRGDFIVIDNCFIDRAKIFLRAESSLLLYLRAGDDVALEGSDNTSVWTAMSPNSHNSLKVGDPRLHLSGPSGNMTFINGAGDQLAKAQYAAAIARRDVRWAAAAATFHSAWQHAPDVDARESACKALSRAVHIAQPPGDDPNHEEASRFLIKTVAPYLGQRLNEAGRLHYAMYIAYTIRWMDAGYSKATTQAVIDYGTARRRLGHDASEEQRSTMLALIRSNPPGSGYHTLMNECLDNGMSIEQTNARIAEQRNRDAEARAHAAELAAQKAAQRERTQLLWEEHNRKKAEQRAAKWQFRPTWQDAYADYRASRGLNEWDRARDASRARARKDQITIMKRQNEQMRRLGYEPLYNIPEN